jgi:hypothetical protein
VHSLGLRRHEEWEEYCKSGNKPIDIPTTPENWEGWPDWFGYEERYWSAGKVKELLHDLIESGIIYQGMKPYSIHFYFAEGYLI